MAWNGQPAQQRGARKPDTSGFPGFPRPPTDPRGGASGSDPSSSSSAVASSTNFFSKWWPVLVVFAFALGMLTSELELFNVIATEPAPAPAGSAAPLAEAEPSPAARGEIAPVEAAPEAAGASPASSATEPAPASAVGTELVYTGSPAPFTADNLLATAERILPRFEERSAPVEYHRYGVTYAEGLCLLAAAVLAEVDVVIESGTAGGQSAELMARFFEGTGTRLYTIDADVLKYDAESGIISGAEERLKAFTHLEFIRDNSFERIPKLLQEHAGKRVGVFVDGPKRIGAMKLCLQSFKASADVKFCAIHDVAPLFKKDIAKDMEQWGRTTVLSYQPMWRDKYAYLDKKVPAVLVPKQVRKQFNKLGFGMGILAGFDTIPEGVSGDEREDLNAE